MPNSAETGTCAVSICNIAEENLSTGARINDQRPSLLDGEKKLLTTPDKVVNRCTIDGIWQVPHQRFDLPADRQSSTGIYQIGQAYMQPECDAQWSKISNCPPKPDFPTGSESKIFLAKPYCGVTPRSEIVAHTQNDQ